MAILIVIVLVAWVIIMWYRNNAVFAYRQKLIWKLHEAALDDINRIAGEGRIVTEEDWKWRYDTFSAVSYKAMVWQFWRTIDSFFPDKSFTMKGQHGQH